MDLHEALVQLKWHISSCLSTVTACALGIGIAFVSLSKRFANPRLTFFLIAIPILVAFKLSKEFSSDDFVNEIFARFLLIFLAHQSFIHCILSSEDVEKERNSFGTSGSNLNVDRKDKKHETKRSDKTSHNWAFAYKMLFNARCLGTRWKTRHVATSPIMSLETGKQQRDEKDARGGQMSNLKAPSSVALEPKSRTVFVLKRVGILFIRYIALCLYYDPSLHLYMPDQTAWKREDFSADSQTMFWRLLYSFPTGSQHARSFLTRAGMIRLHLVGDQMIPDYLILSSYHDVLSIVAVVLRLDTPEEWPPLFGTIWQAYTVRRYWSQFWHLLVYRSFSAHAEYLLTSVLRIPKRSAVTRYSNNALVFVFSGFMHALVEWILSPDTCLRCGCWATCWRYCLQIGAIIFEELFQVAMKAVGSKVMPNQKLPKTLEVSCRLVGYTWVFAWTIWCKEVTFFPRAYCLL